MGKKSDMKTRMLRFLSDEIKRLNDHIKDLRKKLDEYEKKS